MEHCTSRDLLDYSAHRALPNVGALEAHLADCGFCRDIHSALEQTRRDQSTLVRRLRQRFFYRRSQEQKSARRAALLDAKVHLRSEQHLPRLLQWLVEDSTGQTRAPLVTGTLRQLGFASGKSLPKGRPRLNIFADASSARVTISEWPEDIEPPLVLLRADRRAVALEQAQRVGPSHVVRFDCLRPGNYRIELGPSASTLSRPHDDTTEERVVAEDADVVVVGTAGATAPETSSRPADSIDDWPVSALVSASSTLRKFFTINGGAGDVDDLIGEVNLRFVVAMSRAQPIDDMPRYLYGIARNLMRERWRQERAHPMESLDAMLAAGRRVDAAISYPLAADDPWEDGEGVRAALRNCLGKLSSESRSIIVQYYSGDHNPSHRTRLAATLYLNDNALYIRVSRLRQALRGCVERALRDGDVKAFSGEPH